MATIAGSQYTVTGPDSGAVNLAFVTPPASPPAPVGASNLEIFVGAAADAPAPAPGYGLAVLSPSGHELDLVAGSFAVTDNGTGDSITGGADDDTITAFGANNTITGGSGADVLNAYGTGDVVNGGAGPDTISVLGTGDTINGGDGADSVTVYNSGDTVNGGAGPDTIAVLGFNDLVNTGLGDDTADFTGSFDTVAAGTIAGPGTQQDLISFGGANLTFVDGGGPQLYNDTVVGFSQSSGDRIQLTGSDGGDGGINDAVNNQAQQNGGQDTLITLNDGSTILLKGVGHVDSSFFS